MEKISKRPSWDKYFMDIAHVVASRSNCSRRNVAAIIVKDQRIVSTGYNGTPRGIKNCDEGGCPRCNSDIPSGHDLSACLCSHAEENSITQAAYHGISIKGASLYTTFSPCLMCAKMIINAAIKEVIYDKRYSIDDVSTALLIEGGVTIRALAEEDRITNEGNAERIAKKFVTLEEAIDWRNKVKRLNQKLVLTNGCFDVLHRGHAEYLAESSSLGDKMIILINSDRSVRALKGESRPVNDEESRAYLLNSLSFVDKVVVFDGDTCEEELLKLSPDIYVKGGDYTLDSLNKLERESLEKCKTKIVFKPYIKGFSTTNTLNKLLL